MAKVAISADITAGPLIFLREEVTFDIRNDKRPIQRLEAFLRKAEALFSSNKDHGFPKFVYASRGVGYVVWDRVIVGIGIRRAIQIEVIVSPIIMKW